MILGSVTIYKCDGLDCGVTKVVPIELEAEFNAKWHNGLTSHFCAGCKARLTNQAAVHRDEQAALQLKAEVMKRAA